MERKLVKEIVAFCSTEPALLKQNRFTKRTEESLLVKRARSLESKQKATPSIEKMRVRELWVMFYGENQ